MHINLHNVSTIFLKSFLKIKKSKSKIIFKKTLLNLVLVLTVTLDLSQGHGGCGDGGGTKVSGQSLGRVGGHTPKVFLPEHLPPGRRARECLISILKDMCEPGDQLYDV